MFESVTSSACSSLFFSFKLLMNLSVISSHSSGRSISRNPRQMKMVAPNLTTLKITSRLRRSTAARGKNEKRLNQNSLPPFVNPIMGKGDNRGNHFNNFSVSNVSNLVMLFLDGVHNFCWTPSISRKTDCMAPLPECKGFPKN